MSIILHNPGNVFPPYRNYSHAVEVKGDSSLLFISGLNGYLHDGVEMPDSFEEIPGKPCTRPYRNLLPVA